MTHAMVEAGQVPAWTLGWRLQRALAHGGVKAEEMADELGVSRSTVSRWMNDRGAPPRVLYVRQWAMRTGVSLEWLASGELPRLDSNQQPAGYRARKHAGGSVVVLGERRWHDRRRRPRPQPVDAAFA